ncbi:MAG: sialidase family protein [Actinomycetota bacterium]
MALSSNGDIFFNSYDTLGTEVIRSSDRGRTWDEVSPRIGPAHTQVSLDPYLYIDPATDRIFEIDLTVACATLAFSDDGGTSWLANPLACGTPVTDHQTLFAGAPVTSATVGYPNIVYYCSSTFLFTMGACSKSLDGGLTFLPTGTPAFEPSRADDVRGPCNGASGHGTAGSDGTIYLPRIHCAGDSHPPSLAISRDEGLTWDRVEVSTESGLGHEAGVAVDTKNNIYFVWSGQTDHLPYLAVSKDGGSTWSKPMMIGPPGLREGVLPTIAASGRGKIAIAYMGTENSRFGGLPATGSETWNGYMTISATALREEPLFFTSTVNAKNDPLGRGAVCFYRCIPGGDFFDIVIDGNGTVWSAFVDGCQTQCLSGNDNDESEGIVGRLRGGPSLRP